MIKEAFLRGNIPFSLSPEFCIDDNFICLAQEKGWTKSEVTGNFLLKHINTSFKENVVCFFKNLENMSFSVPAGNPQIPESINYYEFCVTQINVYCFGTGTGIVSLYIPYDNGTDEATILNVSSALRCSVDHTDGTPCRCIIQGENETYLGTIAENELCSLFGDAAVMFNHLNSGSVRRIDMFSAVLCERDTNETPRDFDTLCYRLANTYDTRAEKFNFRKNEFCKPHDYTRWAFSQRGCAVVANLTGNDSNDIFLNTKWFLSIKSNYFFLYLMVLHQKYAIYNYLNEVASDADKIFIKSNQEALIDFNSKYIFTIVSDEYFIQNVYMRMKQENNVDEVYTDLLDELKRLFEYSQLKAEEDNEIRNNKLNAVSVVLSLFCSASVIIDTFNLLWGNGCRPGFTSKTGISFVLAIAAEIILIVGCMLWGFGKKKK